jgi:hypothetical protein
MIKGSREYPEELFIDDLFKINKKKEFKDEYKIGTRIKKDNKVLTVQSITINKKLILDLKDKIEIILYEKGGTILEEKED